MLKETIKAFAEVGLEVGMAKTHWTSWPPKPNDDLRIDNFNNIAWEPHWLSWAVS